MIPLSSSHNRHQQFLGIIPLFSCICAVIALITSQVSNQAKVNHIITNQIFKFRGISGYEYLFYASDATRTVDVIVFTVCPYANNTNDQGISACLLTCVGSFETNKISAVYTYSSSSAFSKTCTIKPQLFDAVVTYDSASPNSGVVVTEPQFQRSNLDLNNTIVANFITNLETSFYFAQSATGNEIIAALDETAQEFNSTIPTNADEYADLMTQLMVSLGLHV